MSIIVTEPAKIYAQALLSMDLEPSDVIYELNQIKDTIASSDDLQAILSNSSISFSKKKEILEEIFSGKINENMLKFLLVLTEKNRLNIFEQIIATYKDFSEFRAGIQSVEITSALPLNDEFKTIIINKLENKLNKKISPVWLVSEDIIGGLIFKIGDTVIDSSLKNKIDKLSKTMK